MDVLNIPGLIKSCLLALHLFGLVLGLGAATMLDLIIVRFVGSKAITQEYWNVIALLSKAVTGGLIILWVSGTGFLTYYAFSDPALLGNPKIWAKLAIVGVLSLNGIFIHRVVLPLIRDRIGRPMFDGLTSFQRSCLLASGAISGMSWWIPLLLGAFPQLNFTVAAETILLAYAILLGLAVVSASMIVRYVLPQLATITLPCAEYNALISRLNALARNADAIASGVLGHRRQIGRGSAHPVHHNNVLPTSYSERPHKSARLEAVRVGVPAVLAFLGIVACLAYVLRPPVSSFRIDNDSHASGLAERERVGAGVQLASSAEHVAPEQRAAAEPLMASPVYEGLQPVPEPQSGSPAQNAHETVRESVPQRQVPAKAAFVGIWAVDASACSAKTSADHHAPAMINEDGAAAGDTFCAFEKMTHTGASWQVLARCFNGQERWTSTVRLTVKGVRLTWASRRGVQSYYRCERGSTLAATF